MAAPVPMDSRWRHPNIVENHETSSPSSSVNQDPHNDDWLHRLLQADAVPYSGAQYSTPLPVTPQYDPSQGWSPAPLTLGAHSMHGDHREGLFDTAGPSSYLHHQPDHPLQHEDVLQYKPPAFSSPPHYTTQQVWQDVSTLGESLNAPPPTPLCSTSSSDQIDPSYCLLSPSVLDANELARLDATYAQADYKHLPVFFKEAAIMLLAERLGVLPITIRKRSVRKLTWGILRQLLSGDAAQVEEAVETHFRSRKKSRPAAWMDLLNNDQSVHVAHKVAEAFQLKDWRYAYVFLADRNVSPEEGVLLFDAPSSSDVLKIAAAWQRNPSRRRDRLGNGSSSRGTVIARRES
ncbi:hypothetical protein CBS101457_000287 [Exobasidium rhododendri]|nr:hypothetical protein CBS101457_000287 [Exobasidium rhododendri]